MNKEKMSLECKIIGGFGCILLLICYLSAISTAMAITTYDTAAVVPIFTNESYFSFYNDDSQTYQIYIYNSGNNSDGVIGRVEPHQSIYLPKNASYYFFCEYPDETRFESLENVEQGVNRYWVIVIVLIIIVVALFTSYRIIRKW